jgi:hypothetical protein
MYLHDAVNLVAMRQWAKDVTDGDTAVPFDRAMTASY